MADHTAPGRGPPDRAGPADSAIPGQGCNSSDKRSHHGGQASPWNAPSIGQAAERERLIALHAEAWAADPVRGALATRAISILDLADLFAAGQFGLLEILRVWTKLLPDTCRECGTRLNGPNDIGGFSITSAAISRPRIAIVSGFCLACAARGHEAMQTSAVRALRCEGLAAEIIGTVRAA
jgi:hypothetical protein